MIFDLVKDFADVLDAMPEEHPRRRILKLLDEAIRRDVHFIDRHPTTFFQCMWNTCWWYDCPEAAKHYVAPARGWSRPPPWQCNDAKLHVLLERWRDRRVRAGYWLRSARPPRIHLAAGLKSVFCGHRTKVSAVSFSPDGAYLASSSVDHSVRIWDAVTGRERRVMNGHQAEVNTVAWSPDGTRLASGSLNGDVRLWEVATGAELAVLQHEGRIVSRVSWSSGESRIAIAFRDGAILVFNEHTTEFTSLRTASSANEWFNGVSWSPDGRLLVAGRTPTVWNPDRGVRLAAASVRGRSAWCPLGTHIAGFEDSFARKSTLWVWDMSHLHVSSDNQFIQIKRTDEALKAWTVDQRIWDAVWSPDGKQLLTCGGRLLQLWEAKSGQKVATYQGHDSLVQSVAFSPDGKSIASGGDDGTIYLWDVSKTQDLRIPIGNQDPVLSLCPSHDGQKVATGHPKRMRAWDAVNGTEHTLSPEIDDDIDVVRYSPDCTRVAGGSSRGGTVYIWDTTPGGRLAALGKGGPSPGIELLDWSPTSSHLVSRTKHGEVRLWNVIGQTTLAVLARGSHKAGPFMWSPDGTRVAAAEVALQVWDLRSCEQIADVRDRYGYPIVCLDWSDDSTRIAAGSNHVRIWNSDDMSKVSEFYASGAETVIAVAFSPDGTRVASVWSNNVLRISAVDHHATNDVVCRGHEVLVTGVSWSRDGSRVIGHHAADFGDNSKVIAWSAETGKEEQMLPSTPADVDNAIDPGRESVTWSLRMDQAYPSIQSTEHEGSVGWFRSRFDLPHRHQNNDVWSGIVESRLSILRLADFAVESRQADAPSTHLTIKAQAFWKRLLQRICGRTD